MIFLDSWVWLEFAFDGECADRAGRLIETTATDGGVVAATVIAEVAYRLRREADAESASLAVDAIERFENIVVIPVTTEIARFAAALRDEHYDQGYCELSYADAIHATTATMTDCSVLYTGDPDFESLGVDIETVVL
jgi:predicted nucleic acid-binding protein